MRDTDMEILSVRPSVRHIPETIVLTIIIFHSSFFSQTPNQNSDGIGSQIGIHRYPIELCQFWWHYNLWRRDSTAILGRTIIIPIHINIVSFHLQRLNSARKTYVVE